VRSKREIQEKKVLLSAEVSNRKNDFFKAGRKKKGEGAVPAPSEGRKTFLVSMRKTQKTIPGKRKREACSRRLPLPAREKETRVAGRGKKL